MLSAELQVGRLEGLQVHARCGRVCPVRPPCLSTCQSTPYQPFYAIVILSEAKDLAPRVPGKRAHPSCSAPGLGGSEPTPQRHSEPQAKNYSLWCGASGAHSACREGKAHTQHVPTVIFHFVQYRAN